MWGGGVGKAVAVLPIPSNLEEMDSSGQNLGHNDMASAIL